MVLLAPDGAADVEGGNRSFTRVGLCQQIPFNEF